MHAVAHLLWEQGASGSNPGYPTFLGDIYMNLMQQVTEQLSSTLPFNGFTVIIIGIAIYFAYNKGHLQWLMTFFKKKATGDTVADRAKAYQLVVNHVKSVGATKTQLSSLESISGLVLKEQETNGNQ